MPAIRRAAICLALTSGVALLPAPVPAGAAAFGERTLREGMRGHDVRLLQRHLTIAGWRTTADGAFGRGTKRRVRRFERAIDRRPNGVVSRRDARALRELSKAKRAERRRRRAERRAEDREALDVGELPGDRARLTDNGLAVAPADAPPKVKAAIAAGNEIAKKPYKYGGGHGARVRDSGYDCSGSMSYALRKAGLQRRSMASGAYARWGRPGRGRWITIRANGGHSYMVVAGLRFDTSARKRTGSRWTDEMRSARGFRGRHPRGF